MITAAGNMQPLPVRPIEAVVTGTQAPLPTRRPRQNMQPLPMPNPDRGDLAAALRATAFQRMLDRENVQPLPVIDPTA